MGELRKRFHLQYPGGVVQKVGNNEIQMSVMHIIFNNNCKWSENIDNIFYNPNGIVKKFPLPTPVISRGQFKFSDNIY